MARWQGKNSTSQERVGTEARKNQHAINNDQGKRNGHSGARCPGPEATYTKQTDVPDPGPAL